MSGGREKGFVIVRLALGLVSQSLLVLVKMQGSPSFVCQPYHRVVLDKTWEMMKMFAFCSHLVPGRVAGGDAGMVQVDRALLLHAVAELQHVKAPERFFRSKDY